MNGNDLLRLSETLRTKTIDLANKRVLLTRFEGSDQEKDITAPLNSKGYGRIHHFRRISSNGWARNPLPLDPAALKLGMDRMDVLQAQTYQTAACNWRCWYCYVPFSLLSANPANAGWFSASEILDQYESVPNRPNVIDLTGGQPDLTPEWIPWMMRELRERKLEPLVYLWSDDNLSTDFFFRYLSTEDIEFVRSYHNYGKVCCFKGFDSASFSFNTGASPDNYELQFDRFRRYLDLGIDLYAYATFTSMASVNMSKAIAYFVDKLQGLRPKLPLRTVPLEIKPFSSMKFRMGTEHEKAIRIQYEAVSLWNIELKRRFSKTELQQPICEIEL